MHHACYESPGHTLHEAIRRDQVTVLCPMSMRYCITTVVVALIKLSSHLSLDFGSCHQIIWEDG